MRTRLALFVGVASLSAFAFAVAQTAPVQTPAAPTAPVVGDHSSPLRAVAGDGNTGISNAVMRNQDDVRVLRVQVEPNGTRAMHTHDDVKFHLFVPISGPMTMTVEGAQPVVVPPWQPFYMKKGTRHSFHNSGTMPVEIMEVFVK